MGFEWDLNEILMGFEWDFNGMKQLFVKHYVKG
jgi:hypothetical protein